jgi:hypothetical protein
MAGELDVIQARSKRARYAGQGLAAAWLPELGVPLLFAGQTAGPGFRGGPGWTLVVDGTNRETACPSNELIDLGPHTRVFPVTGTPVGQGRNLMPVDVPAPFRVGQRLVHQRAVVGGE